MSLTLNDRANLQESDTRDNRPMALPSLNEMMLRRPEYLLKDTYRVRTKRLTLILFLFTQT